MKLYSFYILDFYWFYLQNSNKFLNMTVVSFVRSFNKLYSVVRLRGTIMMIVVMHNIRNILLVSWLSLLISIHFNPSIIALIDKISLKSMLYASHIPPKHVFMIIDIIDRMIDMFINVDSSLFLDLFSMLDLFRKIYSIGIDISPISLFSYNISFILIRDMSVLPNTNGNLVGFMDIVLKIYWVSPANIFPKVIDIQEVILKLVNWYCAPNSRILSNLI